MSIKILASKETCDIIAGPGDRVRIYHSQYDGEKLISKTLVAEAEIKKPQTFKRVAIIEFENELGFKQGIAGVLGS